MTPKERARLRGLANGIDTVLQIGKDGIGDTLIHQADITLEARELIKGRVLDSCIDHTPRTAAETLAAATHSEVVQVIGSKFVLYRQKKQVPKKKPVPRPERKETSGKRGTRPEHVRKAEKSGTRPEHVHGNRTRKTESPGKDTRKAPSPSNRPRNTSRRNRSATPKTRK